VTVATPENEHRSDALVGRKTFSASVAASVVFWARTLRSRLVAKRLHASFCCHWRPPARIPHQTLTVCLIRESNRGPRLSGPSPVGRPSTNASAIS